MRTLCLVFILISVVIALVNTRYEVAAIAYMMGISWGTLSGCFIGPFVIGLYWKRVTRGAVWSSIISSLVLTVGLVIFFGYHQNGFACSFGAALKSGVGCSPMIGVICMVFSVIVTVAVSLLTKAPDGKMLYEAFEKPIENEIK
jgi:SSS family solute:Na+ symporter/sodium/proline symporter